MKTINTNQINFPFTTIMPVRITDINYGMHLGHIATAGIFHQARVLFLVENGIDEMNIDGRGLILINSNYSFKHEASFNTSLIVKVAVGEFSKLKFNFIYQALNQATDAVIAEGEEEMVCFDYKEKKAVRIPDVFLSFCKNMSI